MTYAEYRVHCTYQFGNKLMVTAVIKRGIMGAGKVCTGFMDGDNFWLVGPNGNRLGCYHISNFVKKSIKPLVLEKQ